MKPSRYWLLAFLAVLLAAGGPPRSALAGSEKAAEKVVLLELFTSQG
jgi:hypothetical protein